MCGIHDVTDSLVASQQFDSTQLNSSLAARKHLVKSMWPSGQIYDLAGLYEMRLDKMLHYS